MSQQELEADNLSDEIMILYFLIDFILSKLNDIVASVMSVPPFQAVFFVLLCLCTTCR